MGLLIPKPSKRPRMPEAIMLTPPKKCIATVKDRFEDNFDKRVNDLIDSGYILTKRELIIPNNEGEKTFFYAELEKICFD